MACLFSRLILNLRSVTWLKSFFISLFCDCWTETLFDRSLMCMSRVTSINVAWEQLFDWWIKKQLTASVPTHTAKHLWELEECLWVPDVWRLSEWDIHLSETSKRGRDSEDDLEWKERPGEQTREEKKVGSPNLGSDVTPRLSRAKRDRISSPALMETSQSWVILFKNERSSKKRRKFTFAALGDFSVLVVYFYSAE